MMTKYILYLVLSILPVSIFALSTDAACATCTDVDFTTLNNTLTAQDWKATDGSLWRFLPNGHAIASVSNQERPVIAQWEWKRSENCWHLSVQSPQGQEYFQLPLAAGSDLIPNNATSVLQRSNNTAQLSEFAKQLKGQWRASLGRDAGVMSLSLLNKGSFDRVYSNADGKTHDSGYWTLSPDQNFLILFSKQNTQVSVMRIPYVELDEMVLESAKDKGSWFFNRL